MPKDRQAFCVYCGKRSSKSREHVVAQWATKLARTIIPTTESMAISSERGTVVYPHGLEDMATPACVSCNTGWMERIQRAGRPFLEPMILGHWPNPDSYHPLSLVGSLSGLGDWVALTSLNVGMTDPRGHDFFRKEISRFRENGTNRSWRIFVGLRSGGDVAYWRQVIARSHEREQVAAIITVAVGRFVAASLLDPTGMFHVRDPVVELSSGLRKIYPGWANQRHWKSVSILSQLQMDLVGSLGMVTEQPPIPFAQVRSPKDVQQELDLAWRLME